MSPTDVMEQGFWSAIADAPHDEVPRLIFADWLDERDDPRAPLLRERRFWPYLSAQRGEAVAMILGILDASKSRHDKLLCEVAARVGAPLMPGLLERCRAESPRRSGAAELLAALSSECLLPAVAELIELLPHHANDVAPALGRLGAAAVGAVPALIEAERSRKLDRIAFGQTLAKIGPAAGSPALVARLVDLFCEEQYGDPRCAIGDALAAVALPSLPAVLKAVLERAPAYFGVLSWRLAPDKTPAPPALRAALRSDDDVVRWGAACALARASPDEATPVLLDAMRRAPLLLLEAVVAGLRSLDRRVDEALPLLRELLARPEVTFADDVASAVLAVSGDRGAEAARCLGDPDPLVRLRILLGIGYQSTREECGRHALVRALIDPDAAVRGAVGAYCSRVVFLSSQDGAVVAPLRQALGDPDPVVRAGAANALRHLKRSASPAEGDLLALLRQDSDANVRRRAAYSLATLEYETQAMFVGLDAGLDDPDEEVRRTCAWGLSAWDAMTADRVRVVMRRMAQVDRGLADFLAYAVCASQAALPEVVAFLHDTLRNKGGGLRAAAAVRLGHLQVDAPAVLADLFAFLDSNDSKGAEALCRVGPAAVPGLIERLRQGPAEMRQRLLEQMGYLENKHPHLGELLPGVLACLTYQDDEVRRVALRALRGCKRCSEEGARLVEPMIRRERSREVRRDAVAVLAQISPHPEAVAATFADLLRGHDAEVRAAVPDALGHLRLPPEVELELLRAALNDRAASVRHAAARRAGSLGPAALPLVPDLVRHLDGLDVKDWGRQTVMRTLEAMGPAAASALDDVRRRK